LPTRFLPGETTLGHGRAIYPIVAVLAGLSVAAFAIVAFASPQASSSAPSARQTAALQALSTAALVSTVIHFVATGRAAPVMISLGHAQDDETVLRKKLDRFASWHTVRTIFQLGVFTMLIVALGIA